MYTKPSIECVIQTVMATLDRDIAPELQSSRARVSLAMTQTLLQWAIQRMESEHQALITEHNEMTALYRRLAEQLRASPGAVAERIRERGASLGGYPDIPALYPVEELSNAHHRLSEGLIETLGEIDELLQDGDTNAEEALHLLRGHLAVRSAREFQILAVNPGSLVGRE